MDALTLNEGKALLNAERCIGCGLCVTTCKNGALSLKRKPENEQHYIPANLTETYLRLGHVRGKLKISDLIGWKIKSIKDRIISHGI
jgi:Fe-S-cluster-containing hydrogenase component 2